MIDLHTHILPNMDDGAKSLDDSLQILQMEQAQGITKIVLTPHFYCDDESIDAFIRRRQTTFSALETYCEANHMEVSLRLGAEVHFSPKLTSLDLRALAIENTNYILLELPFSHYPAYLHEVIYQIEMQGLFPILAHVERCEYFRKEPKLLEELINRGILAQVNAESLLNRYDFGFARKCLIHGLAQMIASDTHSLDKRPPQFDKVSKLLDDELLFEINENSLKIWENDIIFVKNPTTFKYGLFRRLFRRF